MSINLLPQNLRGKERSERKKNKKVKKEIKMVVPKDSFSKQENFSKKKGGKGLFSFLFFKKISPKKKKLEKSIPEKEKKKDKYLSNQRVDFGGAVPLSQELGKDIFSSSKLEDRKKEEERNKHRATKKAPKKISWWAKLFKKNKEKRANGKDSSQENKQENKQEETEKQTKDEVSSERNFIREPRSDLGTKEEKKISQFVSLVIGEDVDKEGIKEGIKDNKESIGEESKSLKKNLSSSPPRALEKPSEKIIEAPSQEKEGQIVKEKGSLEEKNLQEKFVGAEEETGREGTANKTGESSLTEISQKAKTEPIETKSQPQKLVKEKIAETVKKEGGVLLRVPLLQKKKKKSIVRSKTGEDKSINFILEEYSGALRIQFLQKMIILIVVAIFFVLSVFVFQVYIDYKRSYLIKEQERLGKMNNELKAKIEAKERIKEEAQDLNIKLKKVKYLLDNHIYWSNLFDFLEKKTLKTVYYISFENGGNNQIILRAVTTNFDEMAKQIKVFQKSTEVKKVEVSSVLKSVEKNKERVRFNVVLTFKEDFFYKFFKDKYSF